MQGERCMKMHDAMMTHKIKKNKSNKGDFSGPLQSGRLKAICPRGNNKVVIIIFHVYDKCLFLMLELY
jgi:hypothetical protein